MISRFDRDAGGTGCRIGSFIVVPPNAPIYADPGVVGRLDAYITRIFPQGDVVVAWVVQPRIEGFTVVANAPNLDPNAIELRREQILAALAEFNPEAPARNMH